MSDAVFTTPYDFTPLPQASVRITGYDAHRRLARIERLLPDRATGRLAPTGEVHWIVPLRLHHPEGFVAINRAVFASDRVERPEPARGHRFVDGRKGHHNPRRPAWLPYRDD